MINKLLQIQFIGFDPVRRMFVGHYYSGRYHWDMNESHRPIGKDEYPKFKESCGIAATNVLDWVHHLISLNFYWNETHDDFQYLISMMT